MVRRIGLQQAKQGGDDVPPLQGHPGLSDASEGTGVPESRGEVGVQDPEHHDGARDTRWRDDRMTGRRSHGRLSALNGVVHQGTLAPDSARLRAPRREVPRLQSCSRESLSSSPQTVLRWSSPVVGDVADPVAPDESASPFATQRLHDLYSRIQRPIHDHDTGTGIDPTDTCGPPQSSFNSSIDSGLASTTCGCSPCGTPQDERDGRGLREPAADEFGGTLVWFPQGGTYGAR